MSNQEAYFLQKIKAFMMRKKKSDFLDYRLLTIFSLIFLQQFYRNNPLALAQAAAVSAQVE